MDTYEHNEDAKGAGLHVTAHGDGTFHSVSDAGKRVEHPHIGHLLMHIAKHHGTGDHHHVHAHEDGFTTHHVAEGGAVQGPTEHNSIASVKRGLSDFADQEGNG